MLVVAIIASLVGVIQAEELDAKTLFDRGKTSYALGRYDDAATLFERAFEKKSDPAMLFNAAQAHRLAGHKKKALILYESYLKLYGEQSNSGEVEARITDLKKAIAADEAAAPPPAMAAPAPATTAPPPATTAPMTAAPVATATPAPSPRSDKTPAYKRWWVWTTVGVAVAAGVGVGLGVGLTHTPAAPSAATQDGTFKPFSLSF
jgi:tetratricopeptide (TPR) repeat protein